MGWAIHLEIVYALANKPFGPYHFVKVALAARGTNPFTGKKFWDADMTHNPNIVMHDGKFLLYYIGNYGDDKYVTHRNHDRMVWPSRTNTKARGGALISRLLT